MLALQNRGGIFGVPGYGVAAGDLLKKNALPAVGELPSGAQATVAELIASYKSLDGNDADEKAAYDRAEEFKTRFGIERYVRQTRNLAETIKNPDVVMERVIAKINRVAIDLGKEYHELVDTLAASGFSQMEAIRQADKNIYVSLQNKMAILAVQEPYAFQHEGFIEQLMTRLNYG